MAALKTRPGNRSVGKYLRAVEHPRRREDALALWPLFEQVSGAKARLWGDSIVGFGQYHYHYASGREGDWPVTAFSPRRQNLVIYIMPGFADYGALLSGLGKHRHSVSCLYINKLDDINLDILKTLVARSIADMGLRYECK